MAITGKKSIFSDKGKPSETVKQSGGVARHGPGIAEKLAGEASAYKAKLHPYLPQELIGGAVPYIAGSEEEAVWNAASQACGTEKVHFVYSVDEGRCWFLATPSSSLASDPDSWCPLAAALPGHSEFWDKETVYLYEQEGVASALRWDPDTARMQVFIGAARTLLPRIQSMDANFVTINPDMAEPVRWKNRQLKTELLSRATARMFLLVGIGANLVIFGFLIFQFLFTNFMHRDLATVKRQTDEAASQLSLQAYNALQSDTIRHMVRVQELLDQLTPLGGTLVKYEVNAGNVMWEALVPQAYTNSVKNTVVEVVPQPEKDGRARIRGKK